MSLAIDPTKSVSLAPKEESAFSVIVVYQDLEAGKHAQRICEILQENLRECVILAQMWKFNMLTVPALREMAADDAAMADLIVVSSDGQEDLPADVKAWIELWLGRQSGAFALVSLCYSREAPTEQGRMIQEYLARVAQRGQMEFFGQPDVWPAHKTVMQLRSPDASLMEETFLSVAAVSTKNSNVGHWGLNE